MTIGTQIKKYRNASKLTQLRLAQMLGLTKGAITSWEKDRQNPTVNNMRRLVEILGIELGDLIDESGEIRDSIRYEKPTKNGNPSNISTISRPLEAIPILGYVQGNIVDHVNITENPHGYIDKPNALSRHVDLYAIYITGDNMSPEHKTGDLRVVTPYIPCHPGNTVICIVNHPDSNDQICYIKTFERIETSDNGQEMVILSQLNPKNDISINKKSLVFMHKILTTKELFGV